FPYRSPVCGASLPLSLDGAERSRRPAARRAARAARRAHERAARAEPAAGRGRQRRAARPRAPSAARVAAGPRLRRARPAGPAGQAPPQRMTSRRLAILVAVAVVGGATVAGVGLATQGSTKSRRVLQVDETTGRVGRVVLGETQQNVNSVLGPPSGRVGAQTPLTVLLYGHMQIAFTA